MWRFLSKTIFSSLLVGVIISQALSTQVKADTSNPNGAGKKLQSTPKAPVAPPKIPAGPPQIPGMKALADLEAMQKRNNELSVMHFTQLIQKNPKDSAAYAGRGKAYSGLRDYDKASIDLNKAIELDPKKLEAYSSRAVVRYIKKDYEGSWQDTHKVEELGGAMWPSFLEALGASSGKKK